VTLSVSGWVFNVSTSVTQTNVNFYSLSSQMPGQDVTNLFTRTYTDYPLCTSSLRYSTTPLCNSTKPTGTKENATLQACPLPTMSSATYTTLSIQNSTLYEGYSWDQVAPLKSYLVIDGYVLDMSPYIAANPNPIAGDEVDSAIRQVLNNQSSSGKDATALFYNRQVTKDAIPCLTTRYLAGRIDKVTPGCFVADLFLYTSLVVILGVVLVRFAMACVFNWFMSAKLVRPPKDLSRTAISPAVMPEGANMSVHNRNGTAPWANANTAGGKKLRSNKTGGGVPKGLGPNGTGATAANGLSNSCSASTLVPTEPLISLTRIGAELFAVCLVTCYSEGEDSVRGTIESIAATNYSDSRKLIWVVCDGMITGAGEKRSTPDICVSMRDADPRFGNPMPMGFIAVGSGAKRENRAMVYAGHYGGSTGSGHFSSWGNNLFLRHSSPLPTH
jgi:chitin synthase